MRYGLAEAKVEGVRTKRQLQQLRVERVGEVGLQARALERCSNRMDRTRAARYGDWGREISKATPTFQIWKNYLFVYIIKRSVMT